jgi:RHS repeat-associated protein
VSQAKYPNVVYDDAGNLTRDMVNRTFMYDAENRQVKFNTNEGQYFYDGDGHRVKKVEVGGTTITTVFVYNAASQLIAEYRSDGPQGGGTSYLTTDHLGSTRVVTGAPEGGVVPVRARYDYLPYGEELVTSPRTSGMGYNGASSTRQKFTQKERDAESGLDYFLARYYSSAQGRFLSSDPVRGGTRTPQTWNLYVYVVNNPLRFIDPNGMWHYEEIEVDGKKHRIAVGDYHNEYIKGLGYWNSKTREWAKWTDWNPGLSSFSRGVFQDLARREKASKQALGAFAGGTALVGSGVGVGVYLGGGAFGASTLTLGLSEGGGTVAGLFGTTSVATLQSLAASGGSTEVVVTNLTQAPAAGQALSVATGQGAEALAAAARAGGQLFRAEIPKALIREMERVGLVERITTSMGGATGTELKFLPQATRFITQFFK